MDDGDISGEGKSAHKSTPAEIWPGFKRGSAGERLRLLLIDPHEVLRRGLRILLELESDLVVEAEASSLSEGLELATALQPALAIVDPAQLGVAGAEVVRRLVVAVPGIRVLVLSLHDSLEQVQAAFNAGAVAYVRKFALRADLLHAIRQAARGAIMTCPGVTDSMLRAWLDSAASRAPLAPKLDDDERRVLKLIALGAPTREIAAQLQRGVKAVEKYRINLMRRLGLKNAAAITQFAISSGLLAKDPVRSSPHESAE